MHSGKTLNLRSIAPISGQFFFLLAMSLLIGAAFGFGCALMFKYVRTLTKSQIVECVMLFMFAYLSYIVSEMNAFSGIIALLSCGIIMAHYAWFNLSYHGREGSIVIFQFLAFIAEGFVFSYLGLTFFSFRLYPWSWKFFLILLSAIVFGRALGSICLYYFMRLVCCYQKGQENALNFRELVFIWYAGMIRGAIAFGLVLKIEDSVVNRQVITTTCLSLVVFTTVFCGSTVGLLSACLFPKGSEEHHEKSGTGQSETESDDPEYEKHANYGADAHADCQKDKKERGCLQKLDEDYLRPCFLYDARSDVTKAFEDMDQQYQEQEMGQVGETDRS